MRFLLIALALALTVMYFTFGLRLGYVTLTPTYLLHASGQNRYGLNIYEDRAQIGVRGSCKVSAGTATVRLLDPQGVQVAGRVCPKGEWGLNVLTSGPEGRYQLVVDFDRFTGMIDLKEARQ
ncbi:hypothetical protein [Deinococcus sp.]|uniref:hypothetical protein n=1 Tax=Deinococcus sp. TaxID=47478 RepID=UPI0025C00C92|nr:hypothetical protein [Deinococcus sp.]